MKKQLVGMFLLSITAFGAKQLSFKSWCENSGLEKCNTRATMKATKTAWLNSIEIFGHIVNSPSKVIIEREDFSLSSVETLLDTFGGCGIVSFLSRVPWEKLELSYGEIKLTNRSNQGALEFNRLNVTVDQTVKIKPTDRHSYRVTGITLEGATQESNYTIKSIDFKNVGKINIHTNRASITNVPLDYFSMRKHLKNVTLRADRVVKAITNVVFDNHLNWENKIRITLNGSSLSEVKRIIVKSLAKDALNNSIATLLSHTKTLIIGKIGSNVVSFSMKKPLSCVMKAHNIPILGTVGINFNFGNGFGLYNLDENSKGEAMTEIYGIKTSQGNIRSISFGHDKAHIKVGPVTLPFKYEGTGNSPIRVDALVCK